MAEIEIVTRKSNVSGGPGPAESRGRVELVLNPETGAETVKADNSQAPSRQQSIAKIRAKAQSEGRSRHQGGGDHVGAGAEGRAAARAAEVAAGNSSVTVESADEEETEEAAPETDDAGEAATEEAAPEAGGEEEDAGEAAPEGEETTSEPEKKPPAKKPAEPAAEAADPDEATLSIQIENERLNRENEQIRDNLDRLESGQYGEDARGEYIADPAGYLRDHVVRLFGLDPNDAGVKSVLERELYGLITDLTVALTGEKIGSDKIAQLQTERVGRHWALTQKARKANSKNSSDRDSSVEAANYVDAVAYKAVSSKFPFVALSTELDGISPGKAVVATLKRGIRTGHIQAAGKSEAELITEAIRLTNHSYKSRAERIGARTTALAGTTAAPLKKAAAVKPGAPPPDPSAKPSKPRTLSASEAGQAAPVKPAPGKKPAPSGPRVIQVVHDMDADMERRRSIFDKYKRQRK